MNKAYQQLELSENCRYLTNFYREKGIMRFKRLSYDINNSFNFFEKAIRQSLRNMSNLKFISDNIIIYTSTLQEHIITIKKLFEKLCDLNLKLNMKKCVFTRKGLFLWSHFIGQRDTT